MSITPRLYALVLALLIPAAASAQDTTRSPNPAAVPSTTGSAVPDQREAPVGHRQPRAADIPADARNADDAWLNGLNRDVDKRLKICRDC